MYYNNLKGFEFKQELKETMNEHNLLNQDILTPSVGIWVDEAREDHDDDYSKERKGKSFFQASCCTEEEKANVEEIFGSTGVSIKTNLFTTY